MINLEENGNENASDESNSSPSSSSSFLQRASLPPSYKIVEMTCALRLSFMITEGEVPDGIIDSKTIKDACYHYFDTYKHIPGLRVEDASLKIINKDEKKDEEIILMSKEGANGSVSKEQQ